MNPTLLLIFAFIYVCSVLYAMIWDVTRMRIPNLVPIVLVAAFAVYALLGGTGGAFWLHLILAAAVFVPLFVFFALGWLGAGDVKLAGALMLWAGPAQGVLFIMLFAIFGGVFALALLGLRQVLIYFPVLAEAPVVGKVSRWARNGVCPYGLPIGLAALYVAPLIFGTR